MPNPRTIKRQKHSRACSLCRRKKIWCDASEKFDSRCSKCAMYGIECDYEHSPKRRPVQIEDHSETAQDDARKGHVPHHNYTKTLESRLDAMEDLLEKLRRDAATEHHEGSAAGAQLHIAVTINNASMSESSNPLPPYPTIRPPILSLHEPEYTSDVESSDDDGRERWTAVGDSSRYHGKSSSDFLVRVLAGLKADNIYHSLTWSPSGSSTPRDAKIPPRPWDVTSRRPLHAELPPADLLEKLVDAYFDEFNIYFPLLHRPTFDKCIQEELHVRDEGFCAVVLLICANGSRWVDDERLQRNRGHPPGLHWFERAGCVNSVVLEKPRLYDLQALILTVAYMHGTDAPYGTWTVLGVGARMAQDVGIHRKKTYTSAPTVEDELWRRAFWILVGMDRLTSFGMGRPCAIQDEDFDVDPMTECDDEYWISTTDGAPAFEQPLGRPSKVAFATCLMRLLRILAFASRTIYTTNKSKLLFGFVGPQWKQGVVAELDSALNRWLDTVPTHLRWDPNISDSDPIFFNQSATLSACFYQVQICIHRQFLPTRRKPTLASLPSLTICTTAARSCVRVLYAQHLRTELPKCTLSSVLVPLHTAATMLVIALAASKGNGREREIEELADEIGKCFEMLLSTEPYHQGVGKFRAALHALFIPERPSASDACTTAQSEEPRFLGADDLGGLVVAMMNNLSLSTPYADLEDVGPSWGHSSEAPFYGPKLFAAKPLSNIPQRMEAMSGPSDAQQATDVHAYGTPGVRSGLLLPHAHLQELEQPLFFSDAPSLPAAARSTQPAMGSGFASISLSRFLDDPYQAAAASEGDMIDFTPFFVELETEQSALDSIPPQAMVFDPSSFLETSVAVPCISSGPISGTQCNDKHGWV